MNAQIKQLIDLIESEGWEITDTCSGGFHPKGHEYPKIYMAKVSLNYDTYYNFSTDEISYVGAIFDRYFKKIQEDGTNRFASELSSFLASRKA